MILHSCPPPPDGKTVKTADISPCFNILHICTFPLDHKPIKTHIVSVLFLTVTKTNIYPCFNVCLTVTWSSSKNSSSASASWYCWYSLTCAFEFEFRWILSSTNPRRYQVIHVAFSFCELHLIHPLSYWGHEINVSPLQSIESLLYWPRYQEMQKEIWIAQIQYVGSSKICFLKQPLGWFVWKNVIRLTEPRSSWYWY